MPKISIQIDPYFIDFMERKIADGSYKDTEEIISAGLRLIEKEEDKINALRNAIREGEESGIAKDFDADSYLALLKTL
ncbi:type II toxin-antitoxin system ParD family antitoxin [Sphingobacterium humi]|uniref:Type II toxin-antitoxin system ParD family antitoxin n=1 Tax=Sphingobacterium humi TaxID=1796905 RepID=A0A6N8KZ47_9SPHI|nr:type II toxin-antitoxin system ParD family antitoxin [Sphingobacterium humi]MVZ60842.1 type II toxin-antitoxin system ParD family antitoxin [Sphingobacterium humi]